MAHEDPIPDVVRTRDAVESATPAAVRWRVDRGRWQRVAPRVIARHSGPLSPDQALQRDLLRAGPRGILAGLSAATLEGLSGFTSEATHVLVPLASHGRRRPGLVLHRDRTWDDAVHPARNPPRSRLPRAVVDAARWASSDRVAAAVVVAAMQQRLVRAIDLRPELAVRPGRRRAQLVSAVIDDAELGAGSTLEIDVLRMCRRLRLPTPVLQSRRVDGSGVPRWLDAAWPRYGLVAEIDGAAHAEAIAWWADMRRQNDLWISGQRVLRFPAIAVRVDQPTVARQLVAALCAAGWEPPASVEQLLARFSSSGQRETRQS